MSVESVWVPESSSSAPNTKGHGRMTAAKVTSHSTNHACRQPLDVAVLFSRSHRTEYSDVEPCDSWGSVRATVAPHLAVPVGLFAVYELCIFYSIRRLLKIDHERIAAPSTVVHCLAEGCALFQLIASGLRDSRFW